MLVDFARDPSQTPMIRGPEFFNYLIQSEQIHAGFGGIDQVGNRDREWKSEPKRRGMSKGRAKEEAWITSS
jgi:hypothetical protein